MRSDAQKLDGAFGAERIEIAQCPDHGPYESKVRKLFKNDIRTGCPACSKARTEAEEKSRLEREALEARRALERKLGNALIPRRFQSRDFDGYRADTPKQQKALTTCREYAENFRDHHRTGRCLLLLGKPGTGKTHLSAAIAGHVMRNSNATAVYRTVGSILQHVKGSYDRSSDYSEAEVFQSLVTPDLLIIDEVGATKSTEFEQATLFAVINARYEEELPTIVVSNLMPKELPAALGERCVDRLREGGGIALVFDWDSARSGVSA
ncbi:ATP-binding protein [Azotobacter vinelandii]|uniref:ATP-binding protein n=1 Tax=Azotobacter vinelandii TaxID=354 RepID=UPI000917754D|nr:ATP-binding protein [Azotobacter vinelandii]WKN20840.1 ATP-binding protein [Azotobacter vinelandii]SFY33757.1 DNA replication protein DnaC [Azotobacter vinelandii]